MGREAPHVVAARQAKRQWATNSTQWRKIRAQQLNTEPLCRYCKTRGRFVAAREVDHVDGDATNNLAENLQSLCKSCHSEKTARENGAFGRNGKPTRMRGCDVNGNPVDPPKGWNSAAGV